MINTKQLKNVITFAENLGFRANARDVDHGFFEVNNRDFTVSVGYDFNIITKEYDIAVSNSSVNSTDIQVIKEFSDYVQKAIILADKFWRESLN